MLILVRPRVWTGSPDAFSGRFRKPSPSMHPKSMQLSMFIPMRNNAGDGSHGLNPHFKPLEATECAGDVSVDVVAGWSSGSHELFHCGRDGPRKGALYV